jgi:pimeloyl-ACP methyl ester carboxylesterase
VAAAAHRGRKVALPGEAQGADDIVGAPAARDVLGPAVDGPVPDRAGLVVALVVGRYQPALEAGDHGCVLRWRGELGTRAIPPEDLARIGVPTTLIWGRQDRVMRLRIAEAANVRYGWPLQVIEDAGHISIADQPEAVLRALHTAIAAM